MILSVSISFPLRGIIRDLIVLISIAIIYFLCLSFSSPGVVSIGVGVVLLWGAYGFATVAIYTFAMNFVRRGLEGTDFTLQIVLTHLSSMIIAIMSGRVGDLGGYTMAFSVALCLCLMSAIVLRFYALRQKLYLSQAIESYSEE